MNDVLGAAMSAMPAETGPLSEQVRAKRSLVHAAISQVLDGALAEKRGLLASENRDIATARVHLATLDERLGELQEQEAREANSNKARAMGGVTGIQSSGPAYVTDAATYHKGADSPSFFRDLLHARSGDFNAIDRLRRNNAATGLGETRALGNTGGVGGSGGEFAPPAWLIDSFVKLARPGRVTADLFHSEQLPPGVSSVNLPRVATGTTAAIQTTQNTALSQTDLTSAALSSGIVTIGGKQVVSQQLLDQSPIQFDRVVLNDLAADYARQLGAQVLVGTGASGQLRGYLTPASSNNVAWTQATPTASGFYAQLAKLQGQLYSSRFAAADSVVMHPRRWAWLASYTDSTGRPLIVPNSVGYNTLAQPGTAVASGNVGSILGMDVFTDASIPSNLGVGANQDIVLLFPRDDIWLWESDLRAEALTAPYGDSLGVLFRVYNYAAMIPDRYLASLGQLSGSGLVAPTFAS